MHRCKTRSRRSVAFLTGILCVHHLTGQRFGPYAQKKASEKPTWRFLSSLIFSILIFFRPTAVHACECQGTGNMQQKCFAASHTNLKGQKVGNHLLGREDLPRRTTGSG